MAPTHPNLPRHRTPSLKDTNGYYDRASVAIEFANELGLQFDGDKLHAFGMHMPNTVYTGPFLTYQWRGHHHFAQLDEAQWTPASS